jgi:hypothetical protein
MAHPARSHVAPPLFARSPLLDATDHLLISADPHISQFSRLRYPATGPSRSNLGELPEFGRPDREHSFTSDATFFQMLPSVLNGDFLDHKSLRHLSATANAVACLVQAWTRCRHFDVTFLLLPRPAAATQISIPMDRRFGYLALAFQCNGMLNSMYRWLDGTFTAATRVARLPEIQATYKSSIPVEHLDKLTRVFRSGSPAKLVTHFSEANRQKFRDFGNHKSASDPELVAKAVNKDERHCFVFVLPPYFEPFIPHVHLSPIGIIKKPHKKDRLVFDGSFHPDVATVAINDCANQTPEWTISYGDAFQRHLIGIYNLRIEYPTEVLFLWDDDAQSAFRVVKFHPDCVGAFCYLTEFFMVVSLGQVFGFIPCPANWMIVADARALRAEFLQRPENRHLLQPPYPLEATVQFAPPTDSRSELVQAQRDSFNPGIVGSDGHRVEARHSTFVDDNLTAATGEFITTAIHASLQSLYELLGNPDPLQLDAVAHDKFTDRLCDPVREQLGFDIDTNKLSVRFPVKKRQRLRDTVKQWHDERKSFNALEIARLIGVLYHATTVCWWARFIFIDLQTEVKSILRTNRDRIARSRHFSYLEKFAADGSLFQPQPAHASEFARALWRCKGKNFITKPMRYALRWLSWILLDDNASFWETPISHLIPREPDRETEFDSSLVGAGGVSLDMRFVWKISFPPEVLARTLRNGGTGSTLIDINQLEFVALIISYAATLVDLATAPGAYNQHPPVLLLKGDNTTSLSWLRRQTADRSPAAKVLAHIFATLAARGQVSVNTEHIAGVTNVVADLLSRYDDWCAEHPSPNSQNAFWTFFLAKFPQTKHCRLFHPSPGLLSLIWQALLLNTVPTFDSPELKALLTADASTLGYFVTSTISETHP